MREQHYLYLDVRSVPEFEAGHPATAFNLPWRNMAAAGLVANEHFIAELSACFERDAKLLVGCQAGTRSEQAAQAMLAAGFNDVIVQRAGMDGLVDAFGRTREPGWRASGLPVAFEAEPGCSYAELICRAIC